MPVRDGWQIPCTGVCGRVQFTRESGSSGHSLAMFSNTVQRHHPGELTRRGDAAYLSCQRGLQWHWSSSCPAAANQRAVRASCGPHFFLWNASVELCQSTSAVMRRSFLHPGTLDARGTFSSSFQASLCKSRTAPGNDWVAVVPAQGRLDGVKAGRASLWCASCSEAVRRKCGPLTTACPCVLCPRA